MKPFILVLAIAGALLAAPPSAAQPTAFFDCEPANSPEAFLDSTIGQINSEQWEGKLCLKLCKTESVGCAKNATAVRRCYDAAAKTRWKASGLVCQLNGTGDKKFCTQGAKAGLKGQLGDWKTTLAAAKTLCKSRYDACKAACAP